MDERDWLAERFEQHRSRLRAVALRMLGSASEADDAVQEAWLRLSRSDVSGVQDLGRWLTTVVGRVCLDLLRSREARREEPVAGPVPDTIQPPTYGGDPAEEAVLGESVGLALLVVLDTLAPDERLAFVLHDIFAVPYAEIAPLVDRSTAATKMLASRARRRIRRGGRSPTTARLASVPSSGPSLPRPGTATSTRCSRYWIPMSYSGPTGRPGRRVPRPTSTARPRSRGSSADGHAASGWH